MSSWQRRLAGRGWEPWHIKPLGPRGLQGRVAHGAMAGSEEVQRATALIEERLAQEEENEVGRGVGPKGVLRRPSSAVKGRKSLAAVPGRKEDTCPQGPSWLYCRVLLRGGCSQWETEASAPKSERQWSGRAKLGSSRPCPPTWASRRQAELHRAGQLGCCLQIGALRSPQLPAGRLGQEKLQCLVPEEG